VVLALVESFARPAQGAPRRQIPLRLGPASDEDLLVAVLEEVIYLTDVDGVIPADAHLTTSLGDIVEGWLEVVGIADAAVVGSAPKAVSRNDLFLTRGAGEWRCRALIDV
jgi:SHS2 domain-containing protein